MKRIIIVLLVVISFTACKNQDVKKELPKSGEYANLSGTIQNKTDSVVSVLGRRYNKNLKIDENGAFSDTLKITNGVFTLIEGKNKILVYLKNGNLTRLSYDAGKPSETLQFDGDLEKTNNYLRDKLAYIEKENLFDLSKMFMLDKPEFDSKVKKLKEDLDAMLMNAGDIEQDILKTEMEQNQKLIDLLTTRYEVEHNKVVKFKRGNPSPKFRYPDINGKMVSLDDFKGKYVYVDVWATWCAPCKREIPFLKKLNEEYAGKNIVFVSMSIDKPEDKTKWEKMVKEKGLKGVQIFADNAWNSEFVKAYEIRGIPRFIMIDKEGKIYDANAPRPSFSGIREFINNLPGI